jgi:fatty acid kinase/fatty acid kinase fatty acid binding subunit
MKVSRTFIQTILAGAADVSRQTVLLNQINVFPVVDADTGTNLQSTLLPAVQLLEQSADRHIASLPALLTRPLLLGARGNSGVIFSQFLVGLLDSLGSAGEINHSTFGAAVARGSELARAAIHEPVEGTILTTMSDLARILNNSEPVKTLASHERLEQQLAASVARTPELMPRLSEAQVVDSGALGFHIFACGLTMILPALNEPEKAIPSIEARLLGRTTAPLDDIQRKINPDFLKSAVGAQRSERYCVDLLIETETRQPPADWLTPFQSLGSSIDVARSGDLIKLHLHTNTPGLVIEAGSSLGTVVSHNEDDLAEALINVSDALAEKDRSRTRFRIAGDSSMSLSFELAGQVGIDRLENHVNVHGKMVRDSGLNLDQLLSQMRDGQSFTTAQASPGESRKFIDGQLDLCEHLFIIAVGNAYTGTQAMIRKVAAEHPEHKRISVFDSKAASGQQGLISLASVRFLDKSTDVADINVYINKQIATCREYVVIDNLVFLQRSGRVGKIKAAFANLLSLKPIVGHGDNGAITYAKVRSHASAIDEIINRISGHPGDGSLLLMVEYTDNRKWTESVKSRLADALPQDTEIVVSPLSSTSAVHMGPGTWGVSVTRI